MRIDLASPTDVSDFRAQANTLLARRVAPADIDWHVVVPDSCGLKHRALAPPAAAPSALHSIVPRSFVRMTELVVLHRDAIRFELLYRLLWRFVHEPELAGSHGDADMALAQSMAQAVRRDLLKTRKAARLRPLPPLDGVALAWAWIDPQHRVTELVAESLARQVPQPPWLLASPDRCVLWTGRHLLCGPGLERSEAAAMAPRQWHALASRIVASAPAPVAAAQHG